MLAFVFGLTLSLSEGKCTMLRQTQNELLSRIDTHKGRYGAVKVAQVIPLVLLRTCNRWWWMMFECRGVVERVVTLMRKLL